MSDGPSGNTLVVIGATIAAFLGALATLVTACANFVTAWFSRRNGKKAPTPEEYAAAVLAAYEREQAGEPDRRNVDKTTRHRRRMDDHVDD